MKAVMGDPTPVIKNHKTANGYGTNASGGMAMGGGHKWQHSTANLKRSVVSAAVSNTDSDGTKKTTTHNNNNNGGNGNANGNMYAKNSAYFTEFTFRKAFFLYFGIDVCDWMWDSLRS